MNVPCCDIRKSPHWYCRWPQRKIREKSELAKISKTTSASLSEAQCQFRDKKFTQRLISPCFSEYLLTGKDVFLFLFEYFKAKLAFSFFFFFFPCWTNRCFLFMWFKRFNLWWAPHLEVCCIFQLVSLNSKSIAILFMTANGLWFN